MHLPRDQRKYAGCRMEGDARLGAVLQHPCSMLLFFACRAAVHLRLRRRSGTSVSLPTRTIAEFKPLTQLLHNQLAHVTCDSLGNVFYTTETQKGQDVLFVITDTGIPRATQLTSANILAAMGETVGGSGSIQDVVAGPEAGSGSISLARALRSAPRPGSITVGPNRSISR